MRTLLLSAALLLAIGCATDTPEASVDAASGESATAESASGGGSAGEADAACLVGTWELDPSTIDLNEVPGMSEIPDANFTIGETQGTARLTFDASGETVQRFDRFVLTVNASVSGMSMSVANRFDGTAEAGYAVEGDRIVFTPGEADLTSTVSVNGMDQPNSFAVESLFENAERGEPTFRCDGDVLSLDIRTPEADGGEVMFADARYVRVAS